MADPTYNLHNIVWYDPESVISVSMKDAAEIFIGSLVEIEADEDAVVANDAGPVLGVAIEHVVNTTAEGGGADGDKFIKVASKALVVYEGTAALIANTGWKALCYPTDGMNVTDVAGTYPAGRVVRGGPGTYNPHGFTSPVLVDVGAR